MNASVRQEIDQLVKAHKVLLFMKGVPSAPQCGFSSRVIDILKGLCVEFGHVNVLASDDIRQGIKEYTDWPTIPQLYVDGEFVGGADIIQEMYESGELAKLIGVEAGAVPSSPRSSPLVDKATEAPQISLTPSAIEAIQTAAKEEDSDFLRIEITPLFEHGLFFDEKRDGDFVVERGPVKLLFDAESARRARDLVVDFVDNDERTGFKLDNPNKKRLEKETASSSAAESIESFEHPTAPPAITITPKANEQFQNAIAEEEKDAGNGAKFVIKVGAKRMGAKKVDYDLGVINENEVGDKDLKMEQDGVRYFFDRFSVRNLEGATIDFLDGSEGGSTGFKFTNPVVDDGWQDSLARRFQDLLDEEINPSIAAHGGVVELLDIQGDTAFVLMGGGCQGCGMASVTLSQGIQERVREVLPQIQHLVDTTDHATGTNPYYSSGK